MPRGEIAGASFLSGGEEVDADRVFGAGDGNGIRKIEDNIT